MSGPREYAQAWRRKRPVHYYAAIFLIGALIGVLIDALASLS